MRINMVAGRIDGYYSHGRIVGVHHLAVAPI